LCEQEVDAVITWAGEVHGQDLYYGQASKCGCASFVGEQGQYVYTVPYKSVIAEVNNPLLLPPNARVAQVAQVAQVAPAPPPPVAASMQR